MRKRELGAPEDVMFGLAQEVREAERRDLARDLHDTVVQPLAALVVSFECVEQSAPHCDVVETYLTNWKTLAQEAIASLRGTLTGLHSHPHTQDGLTEAIRAHLIPFMHHLGVRLTLEVEGWPPELPEDWSTNLYLTVREALTNVVKHAHAADAHIQMWADEEYFYIRICDDGIGFSPTDTARAATHGDGAGWGIQGMRDRVRLLDGRLTITTAPGGGTRIQIEVPHPDRHLSSPPHTPYAQEVEHLPQYVH